MEVPGAKSPYRTKPINFCLTQIERMIILDNISNEKLSSNIISKD